MVRLIVFCVFTLAFTGLSSGVGVLPDSVNAAVGDTVMFTTSLSPTQTPFISIAWTFGITNIITSTTSNFTAPEYKDRITLFISNGSLELRNVFHTDAGQYTVRITPAGSELIFGMTNLNVYEPVSNVNITVKDTNLVEFNDSVSLSCSASGSSLSFLWLNHSSELTDNDRIHLTDGNTTLTIVSVSRYDQGPFRCTVSNAISNGTSDPENLHINYGPDDVSLKVLPSNEYYVEGSDVSLSCSADSRPEAEFLWLLNGDMLSVTGAQLSLKNIQMDQRGTYICQAFNTKTLRFTPSRPAHISVLKRISNALVTLSTPTPIEGTSVNLTCDASGSIFTREWRKNGLILKPSENIVFYEDRKVLSFKNLGKEDKGAYTCNISNSFSSQEANYTMTVNYGPENVQISGLAKVQVEKNFKLSCSADSLPTASYLWIKNGSTISDSSEYIKEKSEYSDSGEYVCRATNDITTKISEAIHTVTVTLQETVSNNGCSTGCIVGIVIGCIVIGFVVFIGVFWILRKRKTKQNSTSDQTVGESQGNSANAQNQELNYANVRFTKKEGTVVQLGVQNVRKKDNPPASHLPTYDAHMDRVRRPAPQPIQTDTEYAEIRRK